MFTATLTLFAVMLLVPGMVEAEPPTDYRGFLVDQTTGGAVPDGNYSMTFRIYGSPSGRTLLWTEAQSVFAAGGQYNVLLGSNQVLGSEVFDSESRWLEVTVEGETLNPRTVPGVVPFSLRITTVAGAEAGTIYGDLIIRE